MTGERLSKGWIRLIVAVMLASIYAIVWAAGGTTHAAPHLFYIPIILSALVLSWQESLATAVIGALLMSQWLMPLSREPLIYQTTGNWVLRLFIWVGVSLWTSFVFSFWERRSKAYQAQAGEFAHLYRASLHALVSLTELRDSDVTGKHINRLHHYTRLLTEYFKMSEEQRNIIAWSIAFHDIGKVAMPDSILKKPGPLTPDEWKTMKEHPIHGAKIIDSIVKKAKITDPFVQEYLQTTRDIALYHHEWYDGSGYPYGIKGTILKRADCRCCDVLIRFARTSLQRAFTHDEPWKSFSRMRHPFRSHDLQGFESLADQFNQVWCEHAESRRK